MGSLIYTRIWLDSDWEFSPTNAPDIPIKEGWRKCQLPTSVQAELIKSGEIPHPYKDLNEWEVQCEPPSLRLAAEHLVGWSS